MTSTKSRIIQYILIILVTAAAGGGYWYWKNAKAAGTVSTNRPSFEAPLTTDLNLTAGQGIATYSRADGVDRRATVTDFEGLIRPVKQNEARFDGARRVENLATYSEDFSNAAWVTSINGTGVSATKTPNYAVAPDGTTTAVRIQLNKGAGTTAGVDYATFGQHNMFTVGTGRKAKLSIYLKSNDGSNYNVEIADWNQNATVVLVTPVWQRFSYLGSNVMASGATHYKIELMGGSGTSNTADILAWHPQFEEVTGQSNQNPSEYVSTNMKTTFPYHGAGVDGVKYFSTRNGNTVASNVVTEATGAAIPTATLRGYLAEGNRTNLLLRSEELDNASWLLTGNNATVSANATVAPGGQSVAEKLVEDTATGRHQIYQNYTFTAAAYTVSIYAKAGERTRFEIYIPGTNLKGVGFDLSSVATFATTVAGVSAPTSSSIVSVGNGWYRCQMAWTAVAEATNIRFALNNGTTADSYTGTSGNGLYLWGAQLEQAPFASSYIPTTTASVTRVADSLKYPETGNFNDSAGTASVEVTTEWSGGTGLSSMWLIDSVNGQRFSIWHWTGSSNHIGIDRSGGGGTRNNFDYSGSTITGGTLMKLAQRWTSTANTLFRDGSLRGSKTTLTLPYDALNNSLIIGSQSGSDSCSNLKNVRIWKKALSDTELNNLTSLTDAVATSGVKKTTLKNAPSDTGLVGYWNFDDGSGTKAEDSSPSGTNTGTLTNGPTWVDGKFGKAVNFDGVNDYVRVSSLDNANFPTNGTLSLWVKGDLASQATKSVFDDYSTTRNHVFLRTCSTGSCAGVPTQGLQVAFQNSSTYVFGKTVTVPNNTWAHIVIVWDTANDIGSMYLNGTLVPSGSKAISDSAWVPDQERVSLGSDFTGANYFTGQIDDVRIYNRALSATEIAALYSTTAAKVNVNQNSQLTNGLVGLWSFNGQDVSGTTAYDRSGQGNNGTLTNGPTVYPGKVGQALRFDGVDDRVDIGTNLSALVTTELTVSAWVKPTAAPSGVGRVVASAYYYNATPTNERGWMFGNDYGSNNAFPFFVRDSVGTNTGAVGDGNFFLTYLNQWVHVVGVFKGGQYMQLYENGTKVNEDLLGIPASIAYNPGTNLRIGLRADTTQGQWAGSIDEVRIYNRALSQSEVTALYNAGK